MAMVVKNNMSAVSTLNTLNKNSSALAKSLQKVSSGMRINGAADDASGYAISERMRVQVRSLDQDIRNTQSGASMLKVAEGAVSSTVEILKTLKEKALDSANDTNTDADRATIQKELDQSIDQVNDNALVSFNGKVLLDGSKEIPSKTVEEHIIKALHTEWIENTLDLVEQSLGIHFRDESANVKDIYLQFFDNPSSDVLAQVVLSAPTGGKATDLALQVNMGHFSTLDLTDTSNVNGTNPAGTGTLDRTIAHELTHAIMAASIADFSNLYGTVKEGMAELVHGIDDERPLDPTAVSVARLAMTGTSVPSLYSDGYMALRYMAHQGGDDQEVIKDFINILTQKGGGALDEAVNYATHGKFSGWGDLSQKFVDDVTAVGNSTKFLEDYCGIKDAASGSPADTGAITGQDAGGSHLAKTPDSVVPEGGSTHFWYSPSDSTTIINGLTVHWNTEGMDSAFKTALENKIPTLYDAEKAWEGKVGDLTLQVGTKANQAIKFGFLNMTAEGLGLQDTKGNKLSVATQEHANNAIRLLDQSIQKALTQQTTIGALQSRLEYTASNLTTASENVQASESTIRDSDMAKEMTEYTKNNVLLQASQSMLAQANQNSSAVLSLLQ